MPNHNIDWDFIIDQIFYKKFTPIISNRVINDSIFGNESMVEAWADLIKYPLADRRNLTRVAQFLSVTHKDPLSAKLNYLRFLNQTLYQQIEAQITGSSDFLDRVRREARTLTFSQLATDRFHIPNFQEELDNPLTILASFDIPLYLTTSHHHFMEAALKAVDKTPRIEVYCWREELVDNIPLEFRPDLDFEPTIDTPLIYHFHGIDDYPASLVLTEDDHLEFLVNVTQDFREASTFPSSVRNALSNSTLLLLGYELHAWDLRVILYRLIKSRPRASRSFAIQFVPSEKQDVKDIEEFQRYLQQYFDQVKFNVYWGDPQSFMKTLQEKWEAF